MLLATPSPLRGRMGCGPQESRYSLKNHLHYLVCVRQCVAIRKSENDDSFLPQRIITLLVFPLTFISIVLAAIELNADPCLCAVEVQDVSPERYLPAELQSKLIVPQSRPDSSFSDRHLAPHSPGVGD